MKIRAIFPSLRLLTMFFFLILLQLTIFLVHPNCRFSRKCDGEGITADLNGGRLLAQCALLPHLAYHPGDLYPAPPPPPGVYPISDFTQLRVASQKLLQDLVTPPGLPPWGPLPCPSPTPGVYLVSSFTQGSF